MNHPAPPSGAELARLEAALEEHLRGERAPDLRHLAQPSGNTLRRLESGPLADRPGHRRGWLTAALILVVVAIVASIRLLTDAEGDGKAAQDRFEDAPFQDLHQPPALDIPDGATLARLAGRIQKVRIRVLRHRRSMIMLDVAGDQMPWFDAPMDLAALRAGLTSTAARPAPANHKEAWKNVFSFDLDRGERIEVALRDVGDGRQFLLMRGMGPLLVSAGLRAVLEPALARVEAATLLHSGVLDPDLLQARAGDAAFRPGRMRLLQCGADELRRIAADDMRLQVRRLDLRGSPDTMPHLGLLQRFPALRTLLLPAKAVDAEVFARVAELTELEHLVCLSEYESTGRTQIYQAGAVDLDDRALAGLARLRKLRGLAIAGASFTDQGLLDAKLGESLPELVTLDLSRSLLLTGAGLGTFAGHQRLQRLWLYDLPGFSDAGAKALSTLPNLRRLDLTGCRSFPADGQEPPVTPLALGYLAAIPRLERLSLAFWFCESSPGDRASLTRWVDPTAQTRVFRERAKRPEGLDAEWRGALGRLLLAPQLRYLSLRSSADLVPADLEVLPRVRGLVELELYSCRGLQAEQLDVLRRRTKCRIVGPSAEPR